MTVNVTWDGTHLLVSDAAWHDGVVVGQIRAHVQRETWHRYIQYTRPVQRQSIGEFPLRSLNLRWASSAPCIVIQRETAIPMAATLRWPSIHTPTSDVVLAWSPKWERVRTRTSSSACTYHRTLGR